MKLVLLGKGGSGKSALVNHLLQFSPGDLRAAKESGAGVGVSSVPRLYENYRDGVLVEVWDTPGLDNESNAQQILKKLSESTKERADVVLFCVALSRAMRIDDSYRKLISLLTKTYKPDLWKQTIFVLTFVNETAYKADHQTEKHMGIVQNVKRELQQTLVQAGVSGAIANSVPLLTAGYDSEILPHETEDWNERLFRECVKQDHAEISTITLSRKNTHNNISVFIVLIMFYGLLKQCCTPRGNMCHYIYSQSIKCCANIIRWIVHFYNRKLDANCVV